MTIKTTCTVFVLFLLFTQGSYAQFVSGIPLKDIDAEYIKISSGSRPGNKIVIHLDFGQVDEPFTMKDRLIKDSDDVPLTFNSMMHAINYLSKEGYELFNIYSAGTDGDIDPFYILKRKEQIAN